MKPLPPGARISADQKRAAALRWLGQRWVLHPANRVKRLDKPLPPLADVAATLARVRAR